MSSGFCVYFEIMWKLGPIPDVEAVQNVYKAGQNLTNCVGWMARCVNE